MNTQSKHTHIKIPKGGLLYVIERLDEIPFDYSRGALVIDNKVFDIVSSPYKNTSLENIADMVINLDNGAFDKVSPGKELYYADLISKELGIQIDQMIMG